MLDLIRLDQIMMVTTAGIEVCSVKVRRVDFVKTPSKIRNAQSDVLGIFKREAVKVRV